MKKQIQKQFPKASKIKVFTANQTGEKMVQLCHPYNNINEYVDIIKKVESFSKLSVAGLINK
jgi:hypothetical protein